VRVRETLFPKARKECVFFQGVSLEVARRLGDGGRTMIALSEPVEWML
jgi:hypothetical protein